MPVDILTLMQGDTDYIGKHNANYQNIKALLDALEAHVGAVVGGATEGSVDVGTALFGPARALVGGTSFEPYFDENSPLLNIRPGILWEYDTRQLAHSDVAQQFDFSPSDPGTYYIHINANGGATVSQEHEDAAWSVEWDGTNFDVVVARLPITWAFTDWQAAQYSAVRNKDFRNLYQRFEDIEQVVFPLVYDVAGTAPGNPSANDVLLRYPFPRKVEFAADLPLSRGVAGIAADSQTIFDIRKNNTSIGSMTFAGSATTASFSMAATTLFEPGDVLTVVAPDPMDATLADIGFCLAGLRYLEDT